MTGSGNMLNKEVTRDSNMNTSAIPCHTISINSAAMPDRLQSFNRGINNSALWRPINRGNKANTAIIMLPCRVIGAGFNQARFGCLSIRNICLCVKGWIFKRLLLKCHDLYLHLLIQSYQPAGRIILRFAFVSTQADNI